MLCFLQQGYHRGNAAFFSAYPYRGTMIPVYDIIEGVKFNYFIKIVSAGFLHYKVTLFFSLN